MALIRFFALSILLSTAGFLTGCSLYESDGHKAIEKNSGGIVTVTGFNLELAARYECMKMVALPTSWQTNVVSLSEFSKIEAMEAALDNTKEVPTVLVYTTETRSFEGCSIELLDSKTSTQRLKDIVEFGENLLLLGRD